MARYKSQYTGKEIDEAIGRAKPDGIIEKELKKKQNTLTFDETPIENSTNPITSGATFKSLSEKENKATFSLYTILASGWSAEGTYSFEALYPAASYDLEISLSENTTVEQAEAFGGALIVGNSTTNVIKALGDVPTVDIKVLVKVVAK